MSLINDALKRAKKSQQQQRSERPLGATLQPVDNRPPRPGLPGWLAPAAVILVLGVAGWFFAQFFRGAPEGENVGDPARSNSAAPAVTPNTGAGRSGLPGAPLTRPLEGARQGSPSGVQVNKDVAVRTNPLVIARGPAPSPSTPVVEKPPVAQVPVPAVNPAPVVAGAVPPFPNLVVQAIYFRRTRPSAMISGQTVFEEEMVLGARVVKIERTRVLLEWYGQTNDLRLGAR